MLTSRYMTSVKNLPAIFQKITEGTAPNKFTQAHLKSIGFKSSNDTGVIPVLKDLGFLTPDGTPTHRYHDYRDKSKSRAVVGEALRQAYEDIFHINEQPTQADKAAIEGKFKSVHNATDRIAREQAKTFYALLNLADLQKKVAKKKPEKEETKVEAKEEKKSEPVAPLPFSGLRYNI